MTDQPPHRTASPATLAEVARLAGVSLSTASRVLNGGNRTPRDELRRRVLAAAERLRYSPNAAAQATARGRTNVVGLIVHDISDPYFSSIAAGVMRAADEFGAVTTIADTRHEPEREARLIAALHQQRARAIIIAGSRTSRPDAELAVGRAIGEFLAADGRVALISQKQHDCDTIVVENRAGARALADALVGLGYQRFAALAGPADLRTSADRLRGFRDGLSRRGITLPEGSVITTDFTRDGGFNGAKKLLQARQLPECVFAVNDVMAVGAMAAFREHGLSLPGDLAIAGFDDIQMLRDIVPALTTVRIPLEDLGRQAVRMALDPGSRAPGSGPPASRVRRVACQLILRDSTPPRG
jgi:LacI family transcriptional regulator